MCDIHLQAKSHARCMPTARPSTAPLVLAVPCACVVASQLHSLAPPVPRPRSAFALVRPSDPSPAVGHLDVFSPAPSSASSSASSPASAERGQAENRCARSAGGCCFQGSLQDGKAASRRGASPLSRGIGTACPLPSAPSSRWARRAHFAGACCAQTRARVGARGARHRAASPCASAGRPRRYR